jgi:hypothetical protein
MILPFSRIYHNRQLKKPHEQAAKLIANGALDSCRNFLVLASLDDGGQRLVDHQGDQYAEQSLDKGKWHIKYHKAL